VLGIWDVVSTYYDLRDSDQTKADQFKAEHPEIDMALSMLGETKVSDPLIARYYASLDTVESYYAGKIRMQLVQKFGADITQKQTEYFSKAYEGKLAQKAYLKAHPELREYWSMKNQLEKGQDAAILRIATSLPQAAPGAELREDFEAQNPTQKILADLASGAQAPSWQEISAPMSSPLQARIQAYWLEGQPLPNAAMKELEYLAKRGDYYDVNDMLRQAGYAILQQYQQPEEQPAAPQAPGAGFSFASP
jgi:hypothetical protein